MDLDAYFARIGYRGSGKPDVATLKALQGLHPQAIAFENLNPLLGWPVPIDPEALTQKLVHDGRGGWCFEHNNLFRDVLQALGFSTVGLAARVLLGFSEDAMIARTHMLVRVRMEDGDYIADVGFGRHTIGAPLLLKVGIEQRVSHETYRLIDSEGDFRLQCKIDDAWKSLYRFDLQPQVLPDYEMAGHYLMTHASSPFRKDLMVARATPDRRHAMLNGNLITRLHNGALEQRTLGSVAEMIEVLEQVFLLKVPQTAELEAALAATLERPTALSPRPDN